jgi:nucleoside-diphosphate-sugar epimerase
MARKTILIAGAHGLIGRTMIEQLEGDNGVDVIGLGRRDLLVGRRARIVPVDLTDAGAVRARLGGLGAVTHVVFAAWTPRDSRAAEVAPNLAMLRNLMDAVLPAAKGLRHVTLLQGGKAYGSHLGGFMTPALETDPRHMPPNFYYDQEDLLRGLQPGAGWSWTVFRPTVVYGLTTGNPMNVTTVIGAYAAISRELGLPLRFPGSKTAYGVLNQAVDAGLIGRAILWAGEAARAANEIYNITNGDLFRWSRLWSHIARGFGMEVAEPQPFPLAGFMADKEALWQAMAARHGLQATPYKDVVAWPFGEFVLQREFDHVLDTTKLRAHGFDGFEDTYQMFGRHFAQLQAERIIPRFPTGAAA